MNKKTLIVKRGGVQWAIGGYWTAGERFPKKPSKVHELAQEEGFDPKTTAFVWLKEEQQVGWFSFDDEKIPKAKPLAPFVVRNPDISGFPWYGIFRLDEDVWWCISADGSGSIHPAWDYWGSKKEVDDFIESRSIDVSLIKNFVKIENIEESWDWIIGKRKHSNIPKLIPVFFNKQTLEKVMVISVLFVFVSTGSYFGYKWWKNYKQQQQIAELAKLQRQKEEIQENLLQKEHEKEERERMIISQVQESWKSIEKPWLRHIGWQSLVSRCQLNPSSEKGWFLTKMECSYDQKSGEIRIQKIWKRPSYANVFNRPNGQLQPDGDIVVSSEVINVPDNEIIAHDVPSYKDQSNDVRWLGLKQIFERYFDLEYGSMKPFHPQIPSNVPPDVAQKITPPTLWYEADVSIKKTKIYLKYDNILFRQKGFLPSRVAAEINNGISWSFEGKQYAQVD